MELMQQVKGNYCDSREEEEEEEKREIITATREAESSGRLQQEDGGASNFRKHLDLMELSLGSNKEEIEEGNLQQEGAGGGRGGVIQHHSSSSMKDQVVEKEHMFDKVVTPSDVGKLNRLVIPKQHAEKYFPLDSSSNEKGLLLNFEDRNGKMWRFRYSYWNSSQSYVMTKGWSRFVKEKKLDAGDIVSFQRGLGDLYRHRLYIDWRRRPDHIHAPHSNIPLIPWGISSGSVSGRCYSLPSTMPMPPPHRFHFHHQLNYNNMLTFQQQQQQYQLGHHNLNSGSSASLYYLRSSSMSTPAAGPEMIIDSVPVAHHHHHHHHHHHEHGGMVSGGTSATNSGKRLRLFGVNMECASAEDSTPSSSSSSSLHRLRDYEDTLSLSGRFGDLR